mmetsp:Transcript_3772/g.23781  ORF Transcript_3772/g.23781 Transcript_3772/m.23781 type:complete len:220 (+) Transcript_3772:2106-2765(+)
MGSTWVLCVRVSWRPRPRIPTPHVLWLLPIPPSTPSMLFGSHRSNRTRRRRCRRASALLSSADAASRLASTRSPAPNTRLRRVRTCHIRAPRARRRCARLPAWWWRWRKESEAARPAWPLARASPRGSWTSRFERCCDAARHTWMPTRLAWLRRRDVIDQTSSRRRVNKPPNDQVCTMELERFRQTTRPSRTAGGNRTRSSRNEARCGDERRMESSCVD